MTHGPRFSSPEYAGPVDVDDISPVAQDYLKAIWSATEWGEPPITTTALAARFSTSAPNVTDTVRRLARQGLLDHVPYQPVTLTPEGERLAVAMVRRHRLIETFLVSTLGYRWDEVHEEAERLEHAVTATFVARVAELLGDPESDPHGDPIPRADLSVPHPADALRLDEAPPGTYRVLRISDDEPAQLQQLHALGIHPGAEVRIDGNGRGSTPSGGTLAGGLLARIQGRGHRLPRDS